MLGRKAGFQQGVLCRIHLAFGPLNSRLEVLEFAAHFGTMVLRMGLRLTLGELAVIATPPRAGLGRAARSNTESRAEDKPTLGLRSHDRIALCASDENQ